LMDEAQPVSPWIGRYGLVGAGRRKRSPQRLKTTGIFLTARQING
jgi:hypothetical protein